VSEACRSIKVPAFNAPDAIRCRPIGATPEVLVHRGRRHAQHMRWVTPAELSPVRIILQPAGNLRRERILTSLRAEPPGAVADRRAAGCGIRRQHRAGEPDRRGAGSQITGEVTGRTGAASGVPRPAPREVGIRTARTLAPLDETPQHRSDTLQPRTDESDHVRAC